MNSPESAETDQSTRNSAISAASEKAAAVDPHLAAVTTTGPVPATSAEHTQPAEPEWRIVMRRLGPAGPAAVVTALLPPLGAIVMYSTLPMVGEWLKAHPSGLWIYLGGFIALCGLAIFPTNALMLLAGWAFQFVPGALVAWAGFLGASLLAFGVGRAIAGQRAVEVIATHPRWEAVYRELVGGGMFRVLGLIALLRMAQSPFALTNFALAAVRVTLIPFILGTLIGVLPRVLVGAYAGSLVSQFDPRKGAGILIVIVGIVSMLVVLAIIGQLANRALARVTGQNPPQAKP